ncbi:MAG: hypothetical protein A3C08_03605 [Candidatus Taylorbacteria bacterium RIFCSPHIGHO2_02_FULL_47_18]|uniref:Uncharacterized protein n=1 Tax=Candidatus Taylorbacteria bacterium RIFCSPLOWO2_01_FULL_48_100 TaxID=1802322 RepID=A0A1G2NCQ6_9BACT|nr:MAG: hypothetical protein A2670_00835 [Candidatus Taylorbacteria bacterium RIFCSPHIGHO2_01_FULL_48_38]OHA28218.1 MAG: hypothetical protein A3C08_03605 [Candidatus Taylorbacteria bacterium RIFCSPHIGHO2_02_FULL_47_18]OHA33895.1 MAG: hypothetical protein A2938_02625 [Candidatus Taylorbacteria bacterium RIFCSPLOWO2_01_FULL_48_100]OHA40870.1 MAG: hypothetical protein A3J31_03635 [Candidatus Taylorbacteria bacterium RIFCSPLOWO2_02_FULL_48_16]OHA45118.1 MAG: hypothetical protein A3H13_02950 [Candid
MKFTNEEKIRALKKLPQDTQDYITSPEATAATVRVAEKHNLSKEQRVKFNYIVGAILLQIIDTKQAENEFASELLLPPEQARAIAGEVEKEIFNTNINTNIRMNTNLRMSTNKTETKPTTTPPNLQTSKLTNLPPAPPRPVLIRKELPTPPESTLHATRYTLQTLLSDIKRGTAYDDNRINDAFRKTPIEVKQSLESVGFLSRLEGVAKKFGLNVEETGELVSEAGLVMLGLTQPVNFVDNLTRRLRLPRDRAMAVGQVVNMEILRPVREILRNMNTNIRMNTNLQMATNKTGKEQEQKTEGKYRFAPTTEPPKNLPIAAPNYSPQSTSTQSNYPKDPYREPIE